MMSRAIYADDEVRQIIMVWGIPWERMTLAQADMLSVISYQIQELRAEGEPIFAGAAGSQIYQR